LVGDVVDDYEIWGAYVVDFFGLPDWGWLRTFWSLYY